MAGPTGSEDGFGPPLTARSVIASVLLGTEPPVMSARALVRAGELFGLAEGTVRTALSRMAGAGELERDDDGRYRLVGPLFERQRRQQSSRTPELGTWSGAWVMWVVDPAARSAADRAALRTAAKRLRLAELREGVWLRPDNLAPSVGRTGGDAEDLETVASQARRFSTHPDHDEELVSELWDLDRWNDDALALRRQMHAVGGQLEGSDPDALRDGFVLAAAVLRQFNADPLLPRELLGRKHQGEALRRDFDGYDAAYRKAIRRWLSDDAPVAGAPR